MNRLQRFDMPIAAIAGVAYQNRHRPGGFLDVNVGQRRIHAGREVQQRGRHPRMALLVVNHVAASSKHVPYSPLRNAAQQIEQPEFPAGGVFIQIGAPNMPTDLTRLDLAAQQRQPQPRIELAVQEEARIAIGLGTGDDRRRQLFLSA